MRKALRRPSKKGKFYFKTIGSFFPATLGPVAFWMPATDVAQGTVPDRVGSFHLTQPTAARRPTLLAGPTRLQFDASDDCMIMPFGVTDALGLGDEFSLVVGFRGSNCQSVLRLQTDNSQYVIMGLDQAGTRKCIVSTDSSNTLSITGAEDGSLHHLVWTWRRNQTNGSKLYRNNSVIAQANTPDVALPMLQHTFNPGVGAYLGAEPPSEFTNGGVTHAGVFAYELSVAQVNSLFQWHSGLV